MDGRQAACWPATKPSSTSSDRRRLHKERMASFKFQSTPFTVESPDVAYSEDEILAKYSYETVVVESTKVRRMALCENACLTRRDPHAMLGE